MLTLRSARGYIKNVLYREIPKGCFEATVKFTFQNNIENFQQAGIYFLDKEKNRKHNIRMTFAHLESEEYTEYPRGYQIVKMDQGVAYGNLLREISKSDTVNHSFYFKIFKKNNEFSFYTHKTEENSSYNLVYTIKFDFVPKYLALVSFNGYRNVDQGPLNMANSIPAKFDWVRVESCE